MHSSLRCQGFKLHTCKERRLLRLLAEFTSCRFLQSNQTSLHPLHPNVSSKRQATADEMVPHMLGHRGFHEEICNLKNLTKSICSLDDLEPQIPRELR